MKRLEPWQRSECRVLGLTNSQCFNKFNPLKAQITIETDEDYRINVGYEFEKEGWSSGDLLETVDSVDDVVKFLKEDETINEILRYVLDA